MIDALGVAAPCQQRVLDFLTVNPGATKAMVYDGLRDVDRSVTFDQISAALRRLVQKHLVREDRPHVDRARGHLGTARRVRLYPVMSEDERAVS